jgi:hypothetical protein
MFETINCNMELARSFDNGQLAEGQSDTFLTELRGKIREYLIEHEIPEGSLNFENYIDFVILSQKSETILGIILEDAEQIAQNFKKQKINE